jgi:hypothetical protein
VLLFFFFFFFSQRKTKTKKKQKKMLFFFFFFFFFFLSRDVSSHLSLHAPQQVIHLGGFSDAERQQFRDICHSNVVSTAKALLGAVKQFGYTVEKANEKYVAVVEAAALASELDSALAKAIQKLWRDSAVQQAFARYAEFQLSDSAKYYMDAVHRLAEPDFVPTDEDILRVRAKTTGITEITFQVDDAKFRLVDVGGQRSERKKWMHCFPARTTQLLTNAGFLFLDDVLARIEWRRDSSSLDSPKLIVADWRGLEVATYDPRTSTLVYRQPNAIVVNQRPDDMQFLVEFSSPAKLSSSLSKLCVITTDEHELYARSAALDRRSGEFCKVTAGALFDAVSDSTATTATVEFLAAATGGVAKRDTARWLAAHFGTHDVEQQAAILTAYGRELLHAERVDEWAFAQLDKHAVRCVVAGWLAVARATVDATADDDNNNYDSIFVSSDALRDDLVRLLIHGGYVTTFVFAFDARRRHGWRVSFAERDDATTTLRVNKRKGDKALVDNKRSSSSSGGGAVMRQVGSSDRTWCFDMSSAPLRNDGFVVARSVECVTRAEFHAAAGVRAARDDVGTAPVLLAASMPTIQGNCFDGVTAILFVVAMSEYDLMLYEDQTVRRMEESMKLFDEMCNSQIFIQTPLVLFLNKSDLFREKIKHVDLSVCFPEYKGGADFERACAFTKAKFEALNKQPQTKAIYPHVTCATDTENVQYVFNAVKDTLLTAALDDAGL